MRRILILASAVSLVLWTGASAGPTRAGADRIDGSDGRDPGSVIAPEVAKAARQGTAEAFLILDGSSALAAARAASRDPAARLAVTRPAYAAQKARVFERLTGVAVLEDYEAFPVTLVRFASPAALVSASRDPEVVGIADNAEMRPTLSQSLPLIQQPQAAAAGHVGTGTAVAILDSGIDYRRPAFGSCVSPGVPAGSCKVVHARDFAADDGALDDDGHGTNVGGIVVGVAPATKLLALDVFEPNGIARANVVVRALNFVVSNQPAFNIRAANLSLGAFQTYFAAPCNGTNPFTLVFANLRAMNILPVVASGNDAYRGGAFQDGIAFPACTPGSMSVGAVYDASQGGFIWGLAPDTCTDPSSAADQIGCFSQSAGFLTVLAPGALINAAGLTEGGTSQAAPHVAGAVALLAGANSAAPPAAIEGAIATSGPSILDARNGITKHRLDLVSAISALGPAPPGGDLSVSASASPSPARVGSRVTFRFVLTNDMSLGATGVQLRITPPITALRGPVTASLGSCTALATIVCGFGDLAAGDSVTVDLVVFPYRGGATTVAATATSTTTDPDVSNNTAGARVRAKVVCTRTGTPGNDTLRGTARIDVLCGGGGDDLLIGRGGPDILIGGSGSDRLRGGPGDDLLIGGTGPDLLNGGGGTDDCRGGGGTNTYRGCEVTR